MGRPPESSKIGPHLQKEIRKDKRIWPRETELRAPCSGEEAHKVVLEYEQRESTNRAQVSSVYAADTSCPSRCGPKADRDSSVLNTDTGKGAGCKGKICFHFCNHGNCSKEDKCEYSHDRELRKKALAELKACGDSVGATSDWDVKGKGRGKGRDRSRNKSPGGRHRENSRRRRDLPRGKDPKKDKKGVLCPFFLKSGSCKKGGACDMVHALVVFDNQQAPGPQGAASSSAPVTNAVLPAALAAAQPPFVGLASASLSSPFGIIAEQVLPDKIIQMSTLVAGV